jgi:hypothetical protein
VGNSFDLFFARMIMSRSEMHWYHGHLFMENQQSIPWINNNPCETRSSDLREVPGGEYQDQSRRQLFVQPLRYDSIKGK